MLFLLTGEVQTGKTRWLERQVADLKRDGVYVAGVLAPGVWRERGPGQAQGLPKGAGRGRFEKLGIENLLLPQGERLFFARRSDLAKSEGSFHPESQSAAHRLAWEISDEAIARVNAHFSQIARSALPRPALDEPAGLLVVDELGRLELLHGKGLTEAVKLLAAGASERFPHALVVVREGLCPCAEQRFSQVWGGFRRLAPQAASRGVLRAAFGLQG